MRLEHEYSNRPGPVVLTHMRPQDFEPLVVFVSSLRPGGDVWAEKKDNIGSKASTTFGNNIMYQRANWRFYGIYLSMYRTLT
jgi:hypothetical protein